VVSFSSHPRVLLPLTTARSARISTHGILDGLRAVGSTNIGAAVRTAATLLGGMGERNERIVLVTDGRDTSGAPRSTAANVARAESARGVTVSALGIGADYDDAYLQDLASSGRGNYEFLRDTQALASFVEKELRETARTTARQITAELALPRGVRVTEVSGATWRRLGDRIRLTFGSLFVGDERRAVIAFEAETSEPGSVLPIDGDVSWEPVGAATVRVALPTLLVEAVDDLAEVDAARDFSVLASAVSISASQTELEAARAFERGDRQQALRLNLESKAKLDEVAKAAPPKVASRLRAQQRAYDRDETVYRRAKPSAAPARKIGAREHQNASRSAVGF
jgi:Ca-activated chloride channel family protein